MVAMVAVGGWLGDYVVPAEYVLGWWCAEEVVVTRFEWLEDRWR